jgi:hypothetical protein
VYLGSKAKDSEWSNFGGERLLGAANGDEPKRELLKKSKTVETRQQIQNPDALANEASTTRHLVSPRREF